MSNFLGKLPVLRVLFLVCLWSCGGEVQHEIKSQGIASSSESDIDWHEDYASYLVAFLDELPAIKGFAGQSLSDPIASLRSFSVRARDMIPAQAMASLRGFNPILTFSRQDLSRATGTEGVKDMSGFLQQNSLLGMQRDLTVTEVIFKNADEAKVTLNDWKQRGLLAYAEPNYASEPTSRAALEELFQTYQGGTGVGASWWLQSMRLLDAFNLLSEKAAENEAWAEELFRNPPVIAVLDSGIDYEHPALLQSLFKPTSPNTAGCHNDIYGCNTTMQSKGYLGNGDVFPYGTGGPSESCFSFSGSLSSVNEEFSTVSNNSGVCGHGTHVAGLIAGQPQTATQTGGVCPFCKILPVRVVSTALGGKIPDSAILAGLKYISLFKRNDKPLVRIINMSFGKYTRSRSVSLMIRLLREQGTLMIAAAGNEDSMKRAYPAAYSDALAVSALDRELRRAPYSNFGPWVDIAAPGGAAEDIESSFPGGFYLGQNGTSQAAPLVAGVAGLYVAMNPNASYDDIRDTLLASANGAIYNEDFADGYNRYYLKQVEGESVFRPLLGSGLVDAFAVLSKTPQGYVAAKNNHRVVYGCSVIGSVSEPGNNWGAWLLLFFPLLFCKFLQRRY